MSGQEHHTPISVSGGAGGTEAVTEDLRAAAQILDRASAALEASGGYLVDAAAQLDHQRPLAGEMVDGWVQRTQQLVWTARFGNGLRRPLAGALRECGSDLRATATHYEEAEEQAQRGISWLTATGRYVQDALGVSTWTSRVGLGLLWRWSPGGIVTHRSGNDPLGGALMPNRGPAVTGMVNRGTTTGVLGTVDEIPVGSGMSLYQGIVHSLAAAGSALENLFGEPTIVGIERVEPQVQPHPPLDFSGLFGNLNQACNSDESILSIDTVTQADGSVAYIVNIPGTSDNGLTDADPRDWPNNLAGASGSDQDEAAHLTDYSLAVLAAMEDAGIPPDAPVMLTGHSQGANVAYALASHPDARSKYNVTHVAVAGSPSGDTPRHPDVEYLVLSDVSDFIPGIDGDSGKYGVNETHVSVDSRGSSDPEHAAEATGLTSVHAMDQYATSSEALDASDSASLTHYKHTASPFMGGVAVERMGYDVVVDADSNADQ